MRDALSLLDRLLSTGVEPLTAELLEQFLGCPNSEKIYDLIAKIGDSDAAGTLAATEELISSGLGEVQIVDSLIDYMRDIMVVKSAGDQSELLVLTAEQKNRARELSEKFDIAGLIYNITALEKLRWSIKNSDTPRALLEALLLRFALSEHFLNVDDLLSQLQGSSANAVKKKQPAKSVSSEPMPSEPPVTPHKNRELRIENQEASNERRAKTTKRKRNEIINDPAVKTVLMGLDATITGIEENQSASG